MDASIKNVEIDGYNIAYKMMGEGKKTAIILQGWGTECKLYDSIATAIANRYRVVQFDFPGFGHSDEPKEAWNVDRYTDFFCRFVKQLHIQEAVLIGHSYGGRVIIKLAAREQTDFKIAKIVLVDSAGVVPERSLSTKIKIWNYKFLKKLFNMKLVYFLFPEIIDDWRSRQGSEDYRNASPIMRQCLVMAVNEDLTGLLSKIKQETLLIWGDLDTATPIRDAKIMEQLIPNSGLVVLEGTGHYSFLEKPEQFKKVMQSFL